MSVKKLKHRRFAFVSSSGGGKSTIIKMIIRLFSVPIHLSVSCTTRSKRDDETEGIDYHFISSEEFTRRKASGLFIETSDHMGASYGTLKSECNISNQSVIFDVEVDGANNLHKIFPDLVTIFVEPPSVEVLHQRLTSRGKMSPEKIEARIARYVNYEEQFKNSFDYLILNDDLNKCFADVAAIIFQEMGGMIIAIDGTAGSGKGTHSANLANHYRTVCVDSGLFYRYIAYELGMWKKIKPEDVTEDALNLVIANFSYGKIDEQNLRSSQVDLIVADWAKIPRVRDAVFGLEMKMFYGRNLTVIVAEGRVMTTHIFSKAHHKFYIDADLELRAKRRTRQKNNNDETGWEFIHNELANRDHMDMNRSIHPLRWDKAGGVVKILSHGSINETFENMKVIIETNNKTSVAI